MKVRLVLIALLALGVIALGGCTTKVVTSDGATPLNTVTASGTGEALAAPDMAEMNFGASVFEPDAKAALANANTAAEAIVAAVKDAGVPADDIQTANVSVYPEYTGNGEKAPEISGYRASIQVRVKIRDLEKIGDVIGAASGAGANEINGPSFMLDDDDEAQATAIEDAIADARSRAETMASAAGRTLGEIISVSETGMNVPVYYSDMGYRADFTAAESVAIEPGQLDITASVTVVFALE